MAVGVFAGIPVGDFKIALERYKRLPGAEPTFFPNDIEAVWQLAEDRYVYIIQDSNRAGGAVSMIWVDDPISEVARITGRGLEPVDVENHDPSGSTSSTTPTEMKLELVGRFPRRNKSGQDPLTRPGGTAYRPVTRNRPPSSRPDDRMATARVRSGSRRDQLPMTSESQAPDLSVAPPRYPWQ
jgi:hypothetical protein